ncbi:tetratricopeptide repeat protein [Bdellovibrio sp. HCB337]|uniref:tetratricopeptide repeat protein n=1 Tax=Bdellovibrio sp. HCB337 TaxID=3394358 RepID=UPI0039A4227E
MKQIFSKSENPSFILLGFFSFFLVIYSQIYASKGLLEKPRDLLAPPAGIEHFTFGHKDVTADFFWVRAIQDFDYCDHQIGKNLCVGKGWLYRMLNSITDLSPKFRMPYATGAIALSVMVSDVEGAARIFDKGVEQFPTDWKILYRAAYHYLYEVKDKKKAADLFVKAGRNGAPQWVFSLAGGLYNESNERAAAEAILQEMIKTEVDPAIIKRLEEKLANIRSGSTPHMPN